MSNFVNKINGFFTISIDGVERPNLVVNSGLSNIFRESTIASLCETIKVFNDDTEVVSTDTDFLSPVASSANITKTIYGVGGDASSDYFYMARTWTFSLGQIQGVINKLAVYSDDGTMYAAALLKNAAGELDPVRPLFAPKVDITYESRWHFKQGTSFTAGTPVFFSDAGLVIVKTNMAVKNDPDSYNKLNQPFKVLAVELFSDVITTDDTEPTASLGVVDAVDYNIVYVNGSFGVYGQKLNLVLPESKYINDTPIATIVVTTTRGKWQLGFDSALEKPTLSRREIEISIPFIHGTVAANGDVIPTGNPDAIDSMFSTITNSTYNISTRDLTYTGGLVGTLPAFFGTRKVNDGEFTFIVPADGDVFVLLGESTDPDTYLNAGTEGVMLSITDIDTLSGYVDGTAIDYVDMEFAAGDNITVSITDGAVFITNNTNPASYTASVSATFDTATTIVMVGVNNAVTDNTLVIY